GVESTPAVVFSLHPLRRSHTSAASRREISLHHGTPSTPTRCDACIPSNAMKTLRLTLLAAVAVGCHFDKLFQPSGGVRASRAGARASQLRFTAQPDSTMKDSTIRPPVQVTAFDSTGNVVTRFTGSVKVAIGNNGDGHGSGQDDGSSDDTA